MSEENIQNNSEVAGQENVPATPIDEPKQEEQVSPAASSQDAPKEERRWYVLQTLTGHEDFVKGSIERNIKKEGLENKVFNILVPEEDIVEIKEGKRVERKKKMFPGYVFAEMILDEASWHAMKQTPGVARFIGNKTRPIPASDREMQRVLKQLGVREEQIEVSFEKGEAIRIISGPFRGYTGSVEEINSQRNKIKALVNIFGRDTPVEIDFEQAEKVT
jgi:transcription termination/antitermination protein NusG